MEYNLTIPSNFRKGNFLDTVQTVTQYTKLQQLSCALLRDKLDLDTATGVYLDILGEILGCSRYIDVELSSEYMTWDIQRLGWDVSDWYDGQMFTKSKLSDMLYRLLLKFRSAMTSFDGTKEFLMNVYDTVMQDYLTIKISEFSMRLFIECRFYDTCPMEIRQMVVFNVFKLDLMGVQVDYTTIVEDFNVK